MVDINEHPERTGKPARGHFGTLTPIQHKSKNNNLTETGRKMRRLENRIHSPNSDKDPIRYQWHTRPDKDDNSSLGKSPPPPAGRRGRKKDVTSTKHLNWKEQQLKAQKDAFRVNSDDILDAVRKRIQSPPDHKIRSRIIQAEDDPVRVNHILSHYLANSSIADPVLQHRFKEPGCSCCANVNYANKWYRRNHVREYLPLEQQSEFHYDLSPDEVITVESLLSKRFHDEIKTMSSHRPPKQLHGVKSIHESDYEKNMRKLAETVNTLGEPIDEPVPPEELRCAVKEELEWNSEYFVPGAVPTKYLAFAPRNPLRHKPPHLGDDDYKSYNSRGRMKYVSFSPRKPDIKEYTPENSFNLTLTPYKLVPKGPMMPLTPVGSKDQTHRGYHLDI